MAITAPNQQSATSEPSSPNTHLLAISEIRVPENVRPLDQEHVNALAGSIALRGLLVPVIVSPDPHGNFLLVAGFHRLAAHRQLGLDQIAVEIRRGGEEGEAVDRAIENVTRKQLNPAEEATAVQAMLQKGLTEDGAAQALGWSRQRVTARVRLLELPERARELIGTGEIPLGAVDGLRAIGTVSQEILGVLIYFVDREPRWGRQLASEPGYVLTQALRDADSRVFAAHLNQISGLQIDALKLGKKTDRLLADAEQLHRKTDRYAYGPPPIRFSDADVDEARAAGVLIELDHTAPIIVDRPLFRELVKKAIGRTVEQLQARAAQSRQDKLAGQATRAGTPVDPVAAARLDHGRQVRLLAEGAHGANLDLGAGLLDGLSTVDPAELTVARFFVYGLLGSDYDGSPHTQSGDLAVELAVHGIRLVIDEFRADATKTLKDGSKGRMRIDYGDPRQPADQIRWMWKFIDGARTAGELYGRALVVIAAEQCASRLVVPSSQQQPAKRWPSHKDHARKALSKLAGPHLPATLKQLERAVARAHAEFEQAQSDARNRPAGGSAADRRGGGSTENVMQEDVLAEQEASEEDLPSDEEAA